MKDISYTFIIIVTLALMLVVFVIMVEYNNDCTNRIRVIKIYLGAIRKSIQDFREHNGKYPNSLDELRLYIRDKRGYSIAPSMYVDLNSEQQNDVPEYRQLNNKGGYYYDPNTGEVRLNLTRPVKEYLKLYRGAYKDQIPSSW